MTQRGTTHGYLLTPGGLISNKTGGVLGGISIGQNLDVSTAIKPTCFIITLRQSIDTSGQVGRCRDQRSACPLSWHSRHANRQSHTGAGRDGA